TGHFTHHAYEFVNKYGNVISLKGKVDNKFTKYDSQISYFDKSTKIDKLYGVNGDRIKNDLHSEIQLIWSEEIDIDQPEGFMNFPQPDGEKYMIKSYFSHFEGEKMEAEMNQAGTAIGFRWVKRHSSSINHLFDCRVYNIALKHIFTSMVCKAAKVPVSWVNFMALFGK
ncbi:phage terminase large subunit family protein, partial [Candidatus Pacearchaeota archaeon]|nr:phage terminase large subunit family protein [Candidatus Pacearchaeota archaeon]